MLGIKRIESKEDLLTWARFINNNIGILKPGQIADLQDVYAHSGYGAVARFFVEAEGDRKLIICSVNNVMSFEEVERLLNELAKHKCQRRMEQEYKELDRRIDKIEARERALADSKKPLFKRFRNQETTIESQNRTIGALTRRVEQLTEERNAAHLRALDYEVKAEKYDQIKSLLA